MKLLLLLWCSWVVSLGQTTINGKPGQLVQLYLQLRDPATTGPTSSISWTLTNSTSVGIAYYVKAANMPGRLQCKKGGVECNLTSTQLNNWTTPIVTYSFRAPLNPGTYSMNVLTTKGPSLVYSQFQTKTGNISITPSSANLKEGIPQLFTQTFPDGSSKTITAVLSIPEPRSTGYAIELLPRSDSVEVKWEFQSGPTSGIFPLGSSINLVVVK